MSEPTTKKLPVTLNQGDLLETADSLARKMFEIRRRREKLAAYTSEEKSAIKTLVAEADEFQEAILGQVEFRDVEVKERLKPSHRIVEIYRVDTGDVVETRPMTAAEWQSTLPFGGEKGPECTE